MAEEELPPKWGPLDYVLPEKKEYERNRFSALGEVMNSTIALASRMEIEGQTHDTSMHSGTEFSRKEFLRSMDKRGIPNATRESVMSRYLGDWEGAEAALAYQTHLNETNQQVQDQFSTTAMMAYGLPMAILDPTDAFLIHPAIKAANMLKRGLNLTTRIAKITHAAGTGAAVGVAGAVTYEAATGEYRDDSLVHSAVLGALLGGSLGLLTAKGPEMPGTRAETDAEGRVLAKEERVAEKHATATKELEELDELLGEVVELTKGRKDAKVAADAATKIDAKEARGVAKTAGLQLAETVRTLTTAAKATTGLAKTAHKKLEDIIKGKKEVESVILKTEKASTEVKGLQAKSKELLASAKPLAATVKTLSNKLAKLKESQLAPTKKSTAEIATVTAQVEKAATALSKVTSKQAVLQKQLSKLDADPAKTLKDVNAQHKALVKGEKAALKESNAAAKVAKTDSESVIAARAERDGFSAKESAAANVIAGKGTQALLDKLAKYDADLSPEGLRKLIQARKGLSSDVEKLLDGDDFSVKSLYGFKATQKNFIQKLHEELESFGTVKDFTQSKDFKKMPTWLSISPIENLLNGANNLVSGFSSRLHTGTFYHGKVNQRTAWTLSNVLHNQLKYTHQGVRSNYHLAVKEGYTGKFEEFEAEVLNDFVKGNSKMQEELYTGLPGGLDEVARLEYANSRMGSMQRTHSSNNKFVQDSTKLYAKYYEDINVRGKKLGLDAFAFTNPKGYLNRVYSESKINELGGKDAAINHLVEAQVKFAQTTNAAVTTEAAKAEFLALATTAVEATLARTGIKQSVIAPLTGKSKSTTSALQARTIQVFDEDLIPLVEGSLELTSQTYGLRMHGNFALKEATGMHLDSEFETFFNTMNASINEKANLRAVIQTIRGVKEISQNPYDPSTRIMKALGSYTSIMHTMAFAVPTATEIATVAAQFGWSKTINTLMGTPGDVYKAYRYGTVHDKNSIQMMISYGDANFNVKANRFEADGALDSVGFQNKLDIAVQKSAVFSGLLPLTDMLRMTTAALSVDFLAGLSVLGKKISKADMKRMQDMGFDAEDLERIRTTLQVDAKGAIGNFNRSTWGKLDEDITLAVMNNVERTILHPNGATLPKFMTNMDGGQFVPRIMMKFMRFPFESYERLLVRGMQEADIKQLMGFAGNTAMWGGILMMKDAIRDPEDQKYSGSDGLGALAKDSFLYNSYTALPVSMTDTFSGLLTGDNFTNDYKYRVGGAVWGDFTKLQQGNPTYSVPFASMNLGDAVGSLMNQINFLDNFWEE